MILKLSVETRGVHVHIQSFIGVDQDHLQLAGKLILALDEWPLYKTIIRDGCQNVLAAGKHVELIIEERENEERAP